jgi:hypothetical protein
MRFYLEEERRQRAAAEIAQMQAEEQALLERLANTRAYQRNAYAALESMVAISPATTITPSISTLASSS